MAQLLRTRVHSEAIAALGGGEAEQNLTTSKFEALLAGTREFWGATAWRGFVDNLVFLRGCHTVGC